MPPESVTLREFIELRFKTLERELANVREAIERLAAGMVTRQQFEHIRAQVEELRREADAFSSLAAKLEADMRLVRWVGGAAVALLLAVAAAWMKSLLGL